MNYKVTLSLLLFFFIHVQSAIIPEKTRPDGKAGLQGEAPIPTQRVYLEEGTENHNTIVSSPMKKEINKKLCDQCRHSKLCRVEDDCKHCSQYCKTYEIEAKRDVQSFHDEVGIAREPDEDFVRAEDEKDQTLVSAVNENSQEHVQRTNEVSAEDVQMRQQEPDDEVVQMIHQPGGNDQLSLGKANGELVENIHQEPDDEANEMTREAEATQKGRKKINPREQESQYYIVGAMNPGLSLNILLRLTNLRKSNDVEKAVVLVKSKTPVQADEDMLKDLGDSIFLKILEKELEKADRMNRGRSKISIRDLNRIVERAFEEANVESRDRSHIVGIGNNPADNSQNETVGCSKEESETLPFFPLQPNIYRSGSRSESEKTPHRGVIVEPESLEEMDSNEEKQSKNPGVIQGNPRIESRSNPLQTDAAKEHLKHSIRAHEIIDSISDQLKHLENMNFVGSSKAKPAQESKLRDMKDDEQSSQPEQMAQKEQGEEEQGEEQDEQEQGLMLKNDSEEHDSGEENAQARTPHKKNKKNKKKGGSYGASYGYSNAYSGPSNSYGHSGYSSYGNHGSSYGSHGGFYRQSEDVRDSHEDIEKTSKLVPDKQENLEETKKQFEEKHKELVGVRNEDQSEEESNISEARTHKKKNKKQKYGSYGASYRSDTENIESDKIHIPETNIALDKGKFLSARPEFDSHDGLPKEFHEGIHAHFRKIQEANMKNRNANKDNSKVPKESASEIIESPTVQFAAESAVKTDDDNASTLFERARNAGDILDTEQDNEGHKPTNFKGGDISTSQEEVSQESHEVMPSNGHDKKDETMLPSTISGVDDIPNHLSPTVGISFEPNNLMNLQSTNPEFRFNQNSFDDTEAKEVDSHGSKIKAEDINKLSADNMSTKKGILEPGSSKDSVNIFEENKQKGKQHVLHGANHHSHESMESNESIEHHHQGHQDSSHIKNNNGNTKTTTGHLEEGLIDVHHDFNMRQPPMSESHHIENPHILRQQQQVSNDKIQINDPDKSLSGKTVIQIDDQLIDVPKEGHSIFQQEDHPRMAFMDVPASNNDNIIGVETPTELENNFNQGESESIVGNQNIPIEDLKVNPQIMSDQSGQNLGFLVDINDVSTVKPEFPFKNLMPTKIIPNIPVAGSISASAPAFGENKKIEIRIPNIVSSPMEQEIENSKLEHFSENAAKTVDQTETENSQAIVGAALTENGGTIDAKNIDKLITPQEQEFLHNFGKIVPVAEQMHLNMNTDDVYFMGNGIKLPLKVSQNKDGSLALSVDLEKLCKCKNATCTHRREMMRQLDDNLVGITEDQAALQISADTKQKEIEEKGPIQGATVERKIRKARHHSDLPKLYKSHNRKHHRLHKRSLDDISKKNNIESKEDEIKMETFQRKTNPESDLQNSLIKESSHQEFEHTNEDYLRSIKDMHKFKQVEQELENKLEKLHEDVKKSNKQHDYMLQQGTKDLLQIKGEDQVVKHRIELVNDLLKWMREMAEGMTILNEDIGKTL